MKLFLVVVSVIAVFTADSRDIPGKPDQDDRFHAQPLDRDLHMELNNGSWLVTVQPQGFNSSDANQLFIEEREGRNEKNLRAWRDDGRCGLYLGDVYQCNPTFHHCCSEWGWCGNSDAHCKCDNCVDYSDPKTTPTTTIIEAWRDDGRCGLYLGDIYQCNPTFHHCCSEWGWCGNSDGHCKCDNCVDYSDPKTTPSTTMTEDDKIHYKEGVYYEMIWNDIGSGGPKDVSIWRINILTHGYCSLGDVAVSNYDDYLPTISVSSGPFATHPYSFTKIWTDRGSGATLDGAVYRMNPLIGYTCLGGVAMRSHTTIPDRNRYCCIHNDYISPAGVIETYNDKGTGAYDDLSLWTVWNNLPDVVTGNNFIAVPGYHNYQQAYVINKQKAKKVTG